MKQFRKWLLLGMALLLTVVMAACGKTKSQATAKNQPIHVVASVDFYGQAAKAVLGKYGTVTSIINQPNVDPHDYEPTTGVAKTVTNANVIIANGVGYDHWMDKLAKNRASGTSYIRVGEDLLGKHDGDNPHLWYSSQTMPKLATYLAQKFGKLDPHHAAAFKANAKKYQTSLKPIQSKLQSLKRNSKHQLVDVSEPVFDYTLQELGYRENNQHFAKSVEDGSDPSPADVRKMQADIRQHRIAFFVNNTQASDNVVKNLVKLADEHHVPVLKVTETLPAGKTYQTWMLSQLNQLSRIQNSAAKK